MSSELTGPVRVVGAGLLGTSIGLALRRQGVEVALQDVSEENLRIASGLGAGTTDGSGAPPQLVVVAVPPGHLAAEVARGLQETTAVVTDVGSIKAAPLREVRALVDVADLPRYVGSHPMAGSERSGPFAATAALFDGRPWAIAPHETAGPDAVGLVHELATRCGATAVTFTPAEHDAAVARTSHLPHLLAVLAAARLIDAPSSHLALSGQGVRDVTRIAAGDPALWQQIVVANAEALGALLRDVRADVDQLLGAFEGGAVDGLTALLARGVAGTAVIPGKHGGPARPMAALFVTVPDHPGELARLLADAGEIGVNIEDLRIDHDPGRAVGLVELAVADETVDHLQASLEARSWGTHR